MLKDLLVPMVLGRNERDAVQVACALAQRHEARVDVLIGLSVVSPIVAGWEYFPAGMYDTLDETAKAAAESLAAEARGLLIGETAEYEVRLAASFWLTPAEQALAHAYTSDLILLGRSTTPQEAEQKLFSWVLLGSGRPIMVVPPLRERKADFKRIAVAWKTTREAARAVHDAMPLLRAAETIDVVTVAGSGDRGSQTEGTDANLLRHLDAHGLKASHHTLSRDGRPAGDCIFEFAEANATDLIVAGGYGHARVAEQVFGGVTRTLFQRSPIPVLFSH